MKTIIALYCFLVLSLLGDADLRLGGQSFRIAVSATPLPVGACELIEIITTNVLNVACQGGGGNCVDLIVNGVAPGSNGTCTNTSCTGAAYSLTVVYNGCGGAECCVGGVTVEVAGQNDRAIETLGGTASFTIGSARPGCGGGDLVRLTIACAGGLTLLEADLNTFCDTCD